MICGLAVQLLWSGNLPRCTWVTLWWLRCYKFVALSSSSIMSRLQQHNKRNIEYFKFTLYFFFFYLFLLRGVWIKHTQYAVHRKQPERGDVCVHMHACVQRRICGWQGDGVRDITSHTEGDDNGLSLSVCRQWDRSDDRQADVFNCSCSEPESRQRKESFHTADSNTSSTGVLKNA